MRVQTIPGHTFSGPGIEARSTIDMITHVAFPGKCAPSTVWEDSCCGSLSPTLIKICLRRSG